MSEPAAAGAGEQSGEQSRSDAGGSPRVVPDVALIGAMKAGSTTLFRRLEQHPAIAVGGSKEPSYFSDDVNFARGPDWYRSQLSAGPGLRCDASVQYSDPQFAPVAMRRLREANPDVRLVFVVRHPVERLRSHYRHQVQRSRERRPLADAVLDPANPYVRRSRYAPTLTAVDQAFAREQLLVVHTGQLDQDETWDEILRHLGVASVPRPTDVRNEGADKMGFRPTTLALWERGWGRRAKRVPKPLRSMGRPLFMRRDKAYDELKAQAAAPLPQSVVDVLAEDAQAFSAGLGWPQCPWSF